VSHPEPPPIRLDGKGRRAAARCPYCGASGRGPDAATLAEQLAEHVLVEHPGMAAYDRVGADGYDQLLLGPRSRYTSAVADLLRASVPPETLTGDWLVTVVDLCCGTGLPAALVAGSPTAWWHVTGVDRSPELLDVAARRLDEVVLAPAADTGLPAGRFDLATCVWAWSDLAEGEWAGVLAEAARLLAPGGSLVAVGPHPTATGPLAEPVGDGVLLRPGWSGAGRFVGPQPGFSPGGLRERVGYEHRPLAHLISAVGAEPRLRLVEARELEDPWPAMLSMRVERVRD
jgi:SAM-dependent methyltransferase